MLLSLVIRYVILLSGAITEAHSSRLDWFSSEKCNQRSDIMAHFAGQGIVCEIEGFCKYKRIKNDYQILVKWKGFQDAENTWETVRTLFAEVPLLLEKYIDSLDDNGHIQFKKWFNKHFAKRKG